jgi:dihydroorotase
MNVLIKSATIVDVSSKHHLKKRDLLLTDGKIEKIASQIPNPDQRREISLENLHLSSGWFDSSVCLGEPGFEERETIQNGLKTAALSGFTAVAVNPNTQPVIDSQADIQFLLSKAHGNPVSVYPIGAMTQQGNGVDLAELYDMKKAGAVAFYDYQKPVQNPLLLKLALQYTRNFNGLIITFCNDKQIAGNGVVHEEMTSTKLGLKGIPALAEELHINRNLYLLDYTEGKLHIPTISTEKSIQLIEEAKAKGLNVSCSVSINNLILTDEKLYEFDTRYKILPPLRTPEVNKKLIKALQEGIIDGVTSDHNPIDIEHKRVEFDHALYGSIGLESIFGALRNHFSTVETVDILTRLKGRFSVKHHPINEGETADLTLFNPDKEWIFTEAEIYSSSKNAAMLGEKLTGKAYGIYANGILKID